MEQNIKIKPAKIILTRAEGQIGVDSFDPTEAASFREADSILRKWALTAPKELGYDKVDFKVIFEDGEIYEGRYDLKYKDITEASLENHMKEFLRFLAGLSSSWMSEKQYTQFLEENETREPGERQACLDFLCRYDLGDKESENSHAHP